MKNLILIHRWDGNSKSDWYPNLKKELESKGFYVQAPDMPNSDKPQIDEWVSHLRSIVPNPDKNSYFIGHSIGCQTILRYLQELPSKLKVNNIVFVAPWFHLQNLYGPESEKIAKPWLETPIDFDSINQHITKITCIFSDNDTWVPISDKEIFRKLLGAKIIVEHNRGHFTQDDGIIEFPKVIEEIVTTV